MPRELPLAIPNEVIESELFNATADRTVQRYASASSRDSSHPTPEDGEMAYLEDTGQVEVRHGGSWLGLLPTGIMLPWTAGVAQIPSGWLLCNGQEVSRSTYGALNALYSAADYPHGNGNGSSTFNVPDMRQKLPLGLAVSGTGSTLGETGGNIDHVHSGPNHSHNVGSLATANAGSHSHGVSGSTGNTAIAHTHELGGSTGSGGSHTHSFSDTSSSSSNNVTTTATSGSSLVLAFSSHTHTVSGTTGSGGSHSHSLPANTGTTSSSTNHNHSVSITTSTDGQHAHSISGSTANSGTANTGTANPPYLALPFIVKT